MLGEQQHANLWMAPLDLISGASALLSEGWRHPDVDHDRLRAVSGDCRNQLSSIAQGGRNFMAPVGEEPDESFAQQHLVFGDHDAPGSSAVRTVPT
jgi:hypothetical protein